MTPEQYNNTPSQIGIITLPEQRRKIVLKRGAAFTLMVCGESGLGKTTFVNTLFATTLKPYSDNRRRHARQTSKTVEIEITRAELEERGFKIKLTVIDTPGFGDYVNNKDAWTPIAEFLDDQHESYMVQEQQPHREDKMDMRIHACLYFIRPTGHTLKPLDVEAMKKLCTRVNLIPVIAKADTLSTSELLKFKERIRSAIDAQGISVYCPPIEEDDLEVAAIARDLISSVPYSVIGSENDVETPDGRIVKGRQYLWGVAEVENEEHCDFQKLRNLLLRTFMLDLICSTEEKHYEAYRVQQMETRKFGEARPRKLDNPKFKEEEEALKKRFTEQVKNEEKRFRQWEQRLMAERDRLNKDLENLHDTIRVSQEKLDAINTLARNSNSAKR
ncbi:septin [Limtongia smithiae]|uniref:septin n=1 Tax=Limtongia smithiae TaxID=1125753 RepID=UPI0034CDF3C3